MVIPMSLRVSVFSVSLILATQLCAQKQVRQIESFTDVKEITRLHFRSEKEYENGDVITQKSVRNLFRRLQKHGWSVPKQQELLQWIVSDSEFLAKQFSTEKGRKFMRQIVRHNHAIDRIDRLSRMPNGKASVSDLIHKIPNGAEVAIALATTKQGASIGRSLSKSATGKDFNKPTGRLYFEKDLIRVLQPMYKATQTKMVKNRN